MLLLLAACASSGRPASSASPPETYHLYIANESSDVVTRAAFTPGAGIVIEKRIPVGVMVDIDGPHGVTVSPDGRYWYVSLAHGTPFGRVLQFATGADTLVGRVELGLFPASMATSAEGRFLFVVNFNLHGDMVPSSVSVVYTPTMTEVGRPVTCVMPHGSRVNEAGSKQYSTCMMSDQLVEIDAQTFQVSGRFSLAPGHEGRLQADAAQAAHAMTGPACSPTWAQPGRGVRANFVYVTCNKSAEVLEIDVASWRVTRRFHTGRGPYNLAVTPAGDRLLVTLKAERAVTVIDLETGNSVATIPSTQPITHGVVVSPEGRYAFVTNEAVGSTRGTLDVIDLGTLSRVASAELEHQPGGIDVWSASR